MNDVVKALEANYNDIFAPSVLWGDWDETRETDTWEFHERMYIWSTAADSEEFAQTEILHKDDAKLATAMDRLTNHISE